MKKVNYDDVAGRYDERAAKGYLTQAKPALRRLARQIQIRDVLDLGCGTGRSLAWLDDTPGCRRFGLDFSAGMLARAARFNPDYRLVHASAPEPPFRDASFDLVTIVLALHHFPRQAQVVRQAFCLLRPGGALAVLNLDPRRVRHWPIYDFFEGTYQFDLTRFPSVAEQEEMLRDAGFERVQAPLAERVVEEVTGDAIFDEYWLRKESCSQLILLTDDEYRAGLEKIRQAVEATRTAGEEAVFKTDFESWLCHGFKPQ